VSFRFSAAKFPSAGDHQLFHQCFIHVISSLAMCLMSADATSFIRTVNSVSTLYSSFPAFLYLNATWGGYLLDSLLEYQNSSAYTNAYAAEGLGFNYPKAPGDNSDTSQFGVEGDYTIQ